MEGNFTEEVFEDIEEEIEPRPKSKHLILIFMLIAIILSFVANLAISYVVRRFKRLRKQHHNTYIFHHAILNLINFLCMLLVMIILWTNPGNVRYSIIIWIHVFADMITSFLFAGSALTTIMTIDWYISIFSPSKSQKFRKHTNTIIVSAYLYVIFISLYSLSLALFSHPGFFSLIPLSLNYVVSSVMFLFFAAIYLCRRKNFPQANPFVLKIAMLEYFMWLPFCMAIFLSLILFPGTGPHAALVCLVVAFLTPVAQLFAFYFWDGDYKAALWRIFDCGERGQAEGVGSCEDSEDEGAMIYTASNGELQHRVV